MQGKTWKFKNNIDTDLIIPARYLNTHDPLELAKHCMEDADPEFFKKVSKGDFIVAGENFGCGSSREHAPLAIKTVGISCVIAKSFARIFFRNAINVGLPVIECSLSCIEGENVRFDLAAGLHEGGCAALADQQGSAGLIEDYGRRDADGRVHLNASSTSARKAVTAPGKARPART